MANAAQKKKNKERIANLEALNRKYQSRLNYVKQGKLAYANNNYLKAIKNYNSYLQTISEVKEVSEKRLNPGLFDNKKELTELMLISHIFWDLARIYDRTPHLHQEFSRCLKQFQSFTIGNPFQVVNAEMVRRYIRSGKAVNKDLFQEAYQNIYVSSKKCYVATHCFGFDANETNLIRLVKPHLLKSHMGQTFIEFYYRYSPAFVTFLQKNKTIDFFVTKFFLRPALRFFALTIQNFYNK